MIQAGEAEPAVLARRSCASSVDVPISPAGRPPLTYREVTSMFSFRVADYLARGSGQPVQEMCLGDEMLRESLYSNSWTPEDFLSQWKVALQRFVVDGPSARTALLTSFGFSDGGIWWWKLYRRGDRVVFRQQATYESILGAKVLPQDIQAAVPAYDDIVDPDDPIFEWSCSFADIEEFVRRGFVDPPDAQWPEIPIV